MGGAAPRRAGGWTKRWRNPGESPAGRGAVRGSAARSPRRPAARPDGRQDVLTGEGPATGCGDAGAGTAGARGVRIRPQAGSDRAGVPPLARPGGLGGCRGEAGAAVRGVPGCMLGPAGVGVSALPDACRAVYGELGWRVGGVKSAPWADQHRVDRNGCDCARRRQMDTEGATRRHMARRLEPDAVLQWC